MSRKKTSPPPPPPKPRIRDTVQRILLTVLAAVAILYGTAYAFVRTAGFRAFVAGRLEKQLGVDEVRIGGSRCSWNGEVTLTEITAGKGAGDGTAGVRIGELRLTASPMAFLRGDLRGGLRRAGIRDWTVRLSQDANGNWQPAWLGGATAWLGRWGSLAVPTPDAPATNSARLPDTPSAVPTAPADPVPSTLTLDLWEQAAISLQEGTMEWTDASGQVVASVLQVSFSRTPLSLPNREAAHYHLRAGSAVAGPTQVRDLDVELLRTGDSYLVLNLEAVRQPAGTPPVRPRTTSASAPAQPPARPPRASPPDTAPTRTLSPAETPTAEAPAAASPDPVLQRYLQEELAGALGE